MDRTSPCERGRYYRDDNVFERRHHHLENCRRFRKEFYWIRSGDFWTPQTCAACRRQIVRTLKRTVLFLWGRQKRHTHTEPKSGERATISRPRLFISFCTTRPVRGGRTASQKGNVFQPSYVFARLRLYGTTCPAYSVYNRTDPNVACCNAICSCLFHHCMKCGAANCTDLCHPFVLGFFFFFKSVQTFNSLEHTFSATEQ